MMSATQGEALSRLLERQEMLVTSYSDARAVPAAAGFLLFLRRQPALAVLLDELVEETYCARKSCIENCSAILTSVQEWCDENPAAFDKESVDLSGVADGPFRDVVRELREPTSSRATWRACVQLESILETVADSVRERLEKARPELREQLTRSERLLGHFHRLYRGLRFQMRQNDEALPGEAYLALCEHVDALSPKPLTDQNGRRVMFQPHLQRAEAIWKEVEEARRFPPREHGLVEPEVCSLVRRVSVALQTKLAQKQSLQGLVKRFAARCESFDAKRIRDLVANSEGTAEAVLTLEFARYLHENYYNPVLNPDVSGLKPDVIHLDDGPALYVEVKQCAQATAGDIKKAVVQVRDTWQKFANRFETPEAVLLVFRVDGRNLDLPPSLPVSHGRLLIQVVNVAPTIISGSRAAAPLKMTAEELLGEQKPVDS